MALITTDTARSMAAKSAQSRRERKIKTALVPPTPPPSGEPSGDYVAMRLARTRALIDQAERQLALAGDAQEHERLARSLASLSELERVLAGRPAPGSYRPKEAKHSEPAFVDPL
jgi:hypothetical protein